MMMDLTGITSEDQRANRQRLRRRIGELRSAQEPEQASRKSAMICRHLQQLPELTRAQNIMAYAAMGREADVAPYWEKEWAEGKTILLPRVKGEYMEAVRFRGWRETRPGPFGIKEPEGEPFSPAAIEVVLVPGLVFDYNGHRLGYGKGYYDRFLPLLTADAFFCGIAFELQLVDRVFPTERDVRLHAIVTESQIIRIS